MDEAAPPILAAAAARHTLVPSTAAEPCDSAGQGGSSGMLQAQAQPSLVHPPLPPRVKSMRRMQDPCSPPPPCPPTGPYLMPWIRPGLQRPWRRFDQDRFRRRRLVRLACPIQVLLRSCDRRAPQNAVHRQPAVQGRGQGSPLGGGRSARGGNPDPKTFYQLPKGAGTEYWNAQPASGGRRGGGSQCTTIAGAGSEWPGPPRPPQARPAARGCRHLMRNAHAPRGLCTVVARPPDLYAIVARASGQRRLPPAGLRGRCDRALPQAPPLRRLPAPFRGGAGGRAAACRASATP